MLKIFSDYHSGKKIILELHNVEISKGYQIFVKRCAKTLCVNCNSYDTIYELKLKILALGEEDIPPIAQILTFAGEKLKNNRILADYNIQEGSIVVVNFVLRGN